MKYLVLLLLCSATAFAQIDTLAGTYKMTFDQENGSFNTYTLSLNDNGSYYYNATRKTSLNSKKETISSKGNWSMSNNSIVLSSNSADGKATVNLTNINAEIQQKQKRKDAGVRTETMLLFSDSEKLWRKDLKLIKIN